jgi:ArsR family transcriptional regulator, arsenate/arsenite/antimonite-responsive transcriptional repressor / arsenate reductase (thioredoxin)
MASSWVRCVTVKARRSDSVVDGDPPPFLRLVAHPVRWQLLQELVHSDRAVWELTELLGERQNLVSYHLRQLRGEGLVSVRRSSADGRDSYYALDLVRCRALLQGAGGALHPALSLVPAPPATGRGTGRSRPRKRVLFLCTGNSARSQIAEALLERMSGGTIETASAGSHPKPLHANAIRVMRKRGIDISQNRTKHLDEFVAERFDFVITLCDRVREVCPEFPSHPNRVHWSVPDPALDGASDRANLPAFERTASELETRIGFLLHLLDEPSPKRTKRTKRRSTHAAR